MVVFGHGRTSAAGLRAAILAGLAAEPEWLTGEHDGDVIRWTSGPVTTFFSIEPAADTTPDLGVLRLVTPVATVGNMAVALEQCNLLNLYTTTSRWTLTPATF